ncbi:MAG: nucleotidyltransferase domain-containing protein [Magnetococcales bacterium]|nr:nucleotidyltransferase domain-containing protein [Magnetococcales bacterium]
MNKKIDISEHHYNLLCKLLAEHIPDIHVWAYGSRINGTARSHSDLDLVVFLPPDQQKKIFQLREAFEESDLPFRIDLHRWDELPSTFHRTIEVHYIVLQ